jgi:hypothetical protein
MQNNIINVNIPEPESNLVSDLQSKKYFYDVKIICKRKDNSYFMGWGGIIIIDFCILVKK